MTTKEFNVEYNAIVTRALATADKARMDGLIALADVIDDDKFLARDVFDFGLRLAADGTKPDIINMILTNIVELEPDVDKKTLAQIKKDAVLAIQEGWCAHLLGLLLNSRVNTGVEDAMRYYLEKENRGKQ